MFSLRRLIRRFLEHHRPSGDAEERQDDQQAREQWEKQKQREKQEQQEKQEKQQRQARMLHTLDQLQRAMDPLIAAQVYNNSISPLGRLPEELLLRILGFLVDDLLALYCIQRVSATSRRLVRGSPLFESKWDMKFPWRLGRDCEEKLRRLLQKDCMCDNCRRWGDANGKTFYTCKFESEYNHSLRSEHRRHLYCDACGANHNVLQFSPFYQQAGRSVRRCLGRQGSVQLCEQVHITWDSVEAHIADWQLHNDLADGEIIGKLASTASTLSAATRATTRPATTAPQLGRHAVSRALRANQTS